MSQSKRTQIVWISLLFLTVFTYMIGELGVIEYVEKPMIILLILTITFIKGFMVSEFFMGLHSVSTFWRIIPVLYLLFVCTFIWILF